jgi:hypothetical protein
MTAEGGGLVDCGRAIEPGLVEICAPCVPYGKCLMPPPVVVRPAPDPARDARVARRRAEDARRAGRALDKMFAPDECPNQYHPFTHVCGLCGYNGE